MSKGRVQKHSLTWIDRGPSHIHRWQGRCICSWWSMSGRRKVVEKMYRDHVNGRRRHHPHPQELTPADDLPELLQATGL